MLRQLMTRIRHTRLVADTDGTARDSRNYIGLERGRVNQGAISYHARKNLGKILANEELPQDVPQKVAEPWETNQNFKEGNLGSEVDVGCGDSNNEGQIGDVSNVDRPHIKAISEKSFDGLRVVDKSNWAPFEMDVDDFSQKHEELVVGRVVAGDELIKVQNGPKVGLRFFGSEFPMVKQNGGPNYDSREIRQDGNLAISDVVRRYFFEIFCSSQPSHLAMERVFDCVQPCLSPEKSAFLDGQFTPGDKVTSACLNVLNQGGSLENVNETFIVLIPMVKKVERLSDYRPISLCNVIYKVVGKALADRFRVVLNEVISKTQSAFISGRLISDNAIVDFECMHTLQRRKKGRNKTMTIKLDMFKAYDCVEWDFISEGLSRLFFRAKKRKRSFAWGRVLLEKGTRWIVGLGESILVYQDRWLPRLSTFKVYSPLVLRDDALVSDLKLLSERWNEEMIRTCFMLDDAVCILSIPCSLVRRRDSLIWHFDKMGVFSVKSAYHHGCSVSVVSSTSGSGSSSSESWWKYLWCLKFPAKVKLHIWIACRNCLPMMSNLLNRGMRANVAARDASGVCEQIVQSWRPPDQGVYKINSDVAIDVNRNRVGTGAIIHDFRGLVMVVCAQMSPMAEALPILCGLHLAYDLGLQSCVVESDYQMVVSMINSSSAPLFDIGLSIEDILNLMKGPLRCSMFHFSKS
ncbi:hypothetical protein Ddye_005974 [Dipteronia dyeriana]|uniref:Reverse transcriptase n=1 Tax=Dipteronia dyeriana TaxID=168575 RepID=A0AAE0CQB2_9ROSI|nr:hypothetical protein Ddye_005974 [Dipteronia dyeriana]